jgi:hypothetical protein
MNLEKFTDRARGFLQAAQTIAQREDHQKLMPEHLLKALLDDEQGMAASLIRAGRRAGAGARGAGGSRGQAAEGDRAMRGSSISTGRPRRCWPRPRSSRRRPATVSSPSSGC